MADRTRRRRPHRAVVSQAPESDRPRDHLHRRPPATVNHVAPIASGRGSDVLELLARRGATAYLGESVTLLEHLLQCADLAVAGAEQPALVAACLLHDVGWLLGEAGAKAGASARTEAAQPNESEGPSHDVEREGHNHAERGASALAAWFPAAVSEPVRLHVQAKRWLVATEPGMAERLSPESRRTLALQGGPLSPEAAAAFIALPHSEDAIRLRRYDDEAKDPGRRCPSLETYIELLDDLAASQPRSGRVEHAGALEWR